MTRLTRLWNKTPCRWGGATLAALYLAAFLLGGCASTLSAKGNYGDEMKIPYGVDLSPADGPDSIERKGDHVGSPYFAQVDYYNLTSTDTLTILPHFKTIQQTSEWSCGMASTLMVMEYFGRAGAYTEESLAALRPAPTEPSNPADPALAYELNATTLAQVLSMLEAVGGFETLSTLDYGDTVYEDFTLETIQQLLKENKPILVCWNEWGGHWQVIIGYDTMGSEDTADDVLIVADPYDTTDHNQDGYMVYGAQRFYYNFTTYNFFDEQDGNDMLFVAAWPAAQ